MNKKTKRKIEKYKCDCNSKKLARLANNALFDVRFEALKALGEVEDKQIVPDIIKCVDDEIEMVSLQAIDTIKILKPDEERNQLIIDKIEYWNEYDVINNEKTDHFKRFSDSQLLYHYRLSAKNQKKKDALGKIIDHRGGYDNVTNNVIHKYSDEISRYDDSSLVKAYQKIKILDLIEYQRVLETELKNRGGIEKLKYKINISQEIFEKNRVKKRRTIKKYASFSLLSLLVTTLIVLLYFRNMKIKQAEEIEQHNIEQKKHLLDVASQLEWNRYIQLQATQHLGYPDFNYIIELKFCSVLNWFATMQQIQDTYYLKTNSYINDYSDIINKDLIKISKHVLDSIASINDNTATIVCTIHSFFSNNNPDFSVEYSISKDNSGYEIKVNERVDCNFDNDSDDYFYYNSKDSTNELLFYDIKNILDINDFSDSCLKMLNDTFNKHYDKYIMDKLKNAE